MVPEIVSSRQVRTATVIDIMTIEILATDRYRRGGNIAINVISIQQWRLGQNIDSSPTIGSPVATDQAFGDQQVGTVSINTSTIDGLIIGQFNIN